MAPHVEVAAVGDLRAEELESRPDPGHELAPRVLVQVRAKRPHGAHGLTRSQKPVSAPIPIYWT